MNRRILNVFGAMCIGTAALMTSAIALAQDGTAQARFDQHRVVRVRIESANDLKLMAGLTSDMWSENYGIGGPVDFRLSPEAFETLKTTSLDYEVLISNLQDLIDAEQAHLRESNQGGIIAGDEWFTDFKSYDQISQQVNTLVADYPDLASRFSIGQSLEGREIFGLKITAPGGGDKAGVLYNSNQHAREWITPMVTMYIADRLLREYATNQEVQDLLSRCEFFIVPTVNPDGYVYSWTRNRMWRKNRRNNGGGSYGVDLNRNWSVGWGGEGSSGNRDSEIYRGPSAFSEPETQVMRDFILANPHIAAHVDFHSYSQLILWPWGYTGSAPPDASTFDRIGRELQSLIRGVHNKRYDQGQTYWSIYPASGVMPDWTYGEAGALGYTIELRDTGQYGFLLPANQILPNAEEIWPAALAFAWEVAPDVGMTLEIDPLFRGQQAEMRVSGAAPSTMVYFTYSLAGMGNTYVPVLDVTLDLMLPKLAGSDESDGSGNAAYMATVPANAPLILVWAQAAHYQRTSNVVATQINN
ncbi:MAG: hypothetical protein D8M59_14600 [Planctomycetes bacterium]|nr:hypothetical protein [Planctomycetota bacterium]NOG53337.1 hypothetical protein [Planctomycetota bacterium]